MQPDTTSQIEPGTTSSAAQAPADATLTAWFRAIAERCASRTALTLGPDAMTFRELLQAAETLAAGLQARGIGRGAVVAILLDRSFAMVAAALGTALAGAAYLPLDPTFPAMRVQETLADAQPACVISEAGLLDRLTGSGTPVALYQELAQTSTPLAPVTVIGDDLAYIIYTSGSTGQPKGVLVTHSNVTRLLLSTQPWFAFDDQDVWTLFHSFAFDFSVWEMWGCLLHGGRLVIVPYTVSRSPEEFLQLLRHERVTVLNQTPSAFGLLSRSEAAHPVQVTTLRWVIFGGEALLPRSLLPWMERHGDAQPALVNMYGITETTIHVTWRRMTLHDALHERESVLGEPIPDLRIGLLDEALTPVAAGTVGEMYVAGAGVARGYLGRAALTAERFLPDPLHGGDGRIYRTGDLARRRADGELVYHGRADRQVKIHGFRVELGEIEAAVAACPGVQESCVRLHVDSGGIQRLAAYYVQSNGGLDGKTISRFLADRLPAHMRPSLYKSMKSFPMTSNGKIDRAALPDPLNAAVQLSQPAYGSELERTVAELWSLSLRIPAVGLDDNFFDIGGTSLLLIALRSALEKKLGRTLPVVWFFEHTTVRSLAERLGRTERAEPATRNSAEDRAESQREALARMRAARPTAPGRSVA